MKIKFQIPPALAKIASESFVMRAPRPGGVFFRPLSASGLHKDRIDITVRPKRGKRTYAFKRTNKSVN